MNSELQAEIDALKIELAKMAEQIEKERARAVRAEIMVVETKQEAMQTCLGKIMEELHASTRKAQELGDSVPLYQLELYRFECESAEEQGRETMQDMNNVFEALKLQLKQGTPLDYFELPAKPEMPAPLQPTPQEFVERPNKNLEELFQSQQSDPILKPVVIQREPLKKAVKLRLLVAREIPSTTGPEFKLGTDVVRAAAGPEGLGVYSELGSISQMIVEKIRSTRNKKKGRMSGLAKVATKWVDEVAEGSDEICCICLQRLTPQDRQMHRCKRCRALYHQKCLKDWLDANSVNNATCPNCRQGIKMVTDLLEF